MASHPDARVARGRTKAAIAMFALCHVLQARDMRSPGCARRPPPRWYPNYRGQRRASVMASAHIDPPCAALRQRL